MSAAKRGFVVLGLGNILCRDDGTGVRAVQALSRRLEADDLDLPEGTSIIDGGTSGLALLPYLAEAEAVVFIDAAQIGTAPGSIAILDLARSPAVADPRMRGGLEELLGVAATIGSLPGHCLLVGVAPADVRAGLDLSPEVAAALPEVIETVVRCLDRLAIEAPAKPRSLVGANV